MRTYKKGKPTAEKSAKKRMSKKGVYAIALSASVVLVALALTLSLTFGLRKPNNTPVEETPNEPDVPVVVTPAITFSAPLGECNITKAAALGKLVYNDTLKQWRTHNGVDFAAEAGSEVLSVSDGTVTDVENTILEGVVITISHAEGYVSIYKGLDSASVQKGDKVAKGATIGKIGTMMCEQNQGAHLHLEMKKDGKYVVATDYIDIAADK